MDFTNPVMASWEIRRIRRSAVAGEIFFSTGRIIPKVMVWLMTRYTPAQTVLIRCHQRGAPQGCGLNSNRSMHAGVMTSVAMKALIMPSRTVVPIENKTGWRANQYSEAENGGRGRNQNRRTGGMDARRMSAPFIQLAGGEEDAVILAHADDEDDEDAVHDVDGQAEQAHEAKRPQQAKADGQQRGQDQFNRGKREINDRC